jgi:nucleoside phosphorylase
LPKLGDVIVSRPGQGHGGVAFYDAGKLTDDGFEPIGHLNRPPQELSNAVTYMETDQHLGDETFSEYVEEALQHVHTSSTSLDDTLYDTHDTTKEIIRQARTSKVPQIHYGLIASGSWVIKTSGFKREELVRRVRGDVLCFEMEAAGLLNIEFPCLVVRGISDYCDSHKNDGWHEYASLTAACYCKWILKTVQPITTQSSGLAAGKHV